MQILKQAHTKNDNICLHIAIFQISNTDERWIVFPQARYGTLDVFLCAGWTTTATPATTAPTTTTATTSTSRSLKDLVYNLSTAFPVTSESDANLANALESQINALCDALRYLHDGFLASDQKGFYYCAHMDIKPDNVLVFEGGDVGTWKLCDFGISIIAGGHNIRVGPSGDLMTMAARAARMPTDYTAPEIHPGGPPERTTGRSADMWSFGCLFTEVLAFSLNPTEGVCRFRERRIQPQNGLRNSRFYTKVQPTLQDSRNNPEQNQRNAEYEVSKRVVEWLDEHDKQCQDSHPWVHHWIDCIRRCLVIESTQRIKASTLTLLITTIPTFRLMSRPSQSRSFRATDRRQGPQNARESSSSVPSSSQLARRGIGQTSSKATTSDRGTSSTNRSESSGNMEDGVSSVDASALRTSSPVRTRGGSRSLHSGPPRLPDSVVEPPQSVNKAEGAILPAITVNLAHENPEASDERSPLRVSTEGKRAQNSFSRDPSQRQIISRGNARDHTYPLAEEDAISVAFDDVRIVCLTKKSLQSFCISDLSKCEAPQSMLAKDDLKYWTHISLAGEYILLIGKDKKSQVCKVPTWPPFLTHVYHC